MCTTGHSPHADLVFVFRPKDTGSAFDKALEPLGERVRLHGDYDELVSAVAAAAAGDQVVFMSNGGFGGVRQKLKAAPQKASGA